MADVKAPATAEDADEALLSQLRADAGLEHLIHSLELAEGFQLDILVCPTPRVARAALKLIRDRSIWWGKEPVRFEVLGPHGEGGDTTRPVDAQALARQVLDPLLHRPARPTAERTIVVLDGSFSQPRDAERWRGLFRQMNENRNTIIERLRAPALLVVPDFLAVSFAHEAPDFWSVRSAQVSLSAPATPPALLRLAVPSDIELSAALLPLADIQLGVEEARAQARARPTAGALEALGIQLHRLGEAHEARGDGTLALQAFEESLALRECLVDQAPGDAEKAQSVSITLLRIGRVLAARGEFARALQVAQRAVEIRRRLLSNEPGHPRRMGELAVALRNQAQLLLYIEGGSNEALDSAHESLSLLRQATSLEPDRSEHAREFAVALEVLSRTYEHQGELDRASAANEEALDTFRRLASGTSGNPANLRALAVILGRKGRLHRAKGDVTKALAALEESLDITRSLLAIDPHRPQWLADLASTTMSIGWLHEDRGDRANAVHALEQALEVMQRLPAWMQERHAPARDLIDEALARVRK